MHYLLGIAGVVSIAALAAASPVENAIPGGVFTIPQQKNKHFKESTGLDALLHAFSKYNATLPPRLRAAVEINPRIRTKLRQRTYLACTPLRFCEAKMNGSLHVNLGYFVQFREQHVWVCTGRTAGPL